MALFDSIINKTSNKFDLRKAETESLFEALAELMTAEESGGFTGFIERFNQAGLENEAASWVTTGDNVEIFETELKSAIGADTIEAISGKTGVEKDKTAAALAFMIPSAVDRLTPDGRIPDNETARAALYSDPARAAEDKKTGASAAYAAAGEDDAHGAVDSVGDAAESVGSSISGVLDSVGSSVDVEDDQGESLVKWIAPLIVLSLFIVIGFYACSDNRGKPALRKDSVAKPIIQNEKTEDAH